MGRLYNSQEIEWEDILISIANFIQTELTAHPQELASVGYVMHVKNTFVSLGCLITTAVGMRRRSRRWVEAVHGSNFMSFVDPQFLQMLSCTQGTPFLISCDKFIFL